MIALSERLSTLGRARGRKTLFSRAFLSLSIWRERNALSKLDPHLLNDIGVSEAQAKSESARPVWDAPSRWIK